MESINDPRRRWACQQQHTYMTGMPDTLIRRRGTAEPPVKAVRRPCTVCAGTMDGEPIVRHRHAACDVEGRRRYQRALRARDRVAPTATWAAYNAALAGMGTTGGA